MKVLLFLCLATVAKNGCTSDTRDVYVSNRVYSDKKPYFMSQILHIPNSINVNGSGNQWFRRLLPVPPSTEVRQFYHFLTKFLAKSVTQTHNYTAVEEEDVEFAILRDYRHTNGSSVWSFFDTGLSFTYLSHPSRIELCCLHRSIETNCGNSRRLIVYRRFVSPICVSTNRGLRPTTHDARANQQCSSDTSPAKEHLGCWKRVWFSDLALSLSKPFK